MARQNLTATLIQNSTCPKGKKQVFIWDAKAPGMGVRLTPSAKVYIFQGRLDKSKVRIKIGDTKSWAIGHARERAIELKQMTNRGIDPRVEKQERLDKQAVALQNAKNKNIIVQKIWHVYLKARKSRWSERHYIDHVKLAHMGGEPRKRSKSKTVPGVLAALMPLKMADLTKEKIGSWAENESSRRRGQTRLAFSLFRAFLNWCDDQEEYKGLGSPDVCSSRIKREVISTQIPKADSLQREQLRAWFSAVSTCHNQIIAAYLQSLLLTGARREELTHLKWVDVDFKWQSLSIHDKVEGSRIIPLTPYVAYLLAPLPRRNQWVFSSPKAKTGRLQEPRIFHNKALTIAGIEHLTLHGLRRSFGTLSEWVEVPAGVVAQIMGHKPSATVEKHYRQRPLDLLRMWHVKIEEWILHEAGIELPEDISKTPILKLIQT